MSQFCPIYCYKTFYMTNVIPYLLFINKKYCVKKIFFLFQEFNWKKLGMLYHNNGPSTGKGNSACFMTLSAIFTVLQKKGTRNIPNIPFDETNTTTTKIKQLLQKLSLSTRSEYDKNFYVIELCFILL